MTMRYIRPRSLTWWAGVLSIATGLAAMILPGDPSLAEFGRFIALLAGTSDSSPAALMFLGLGLIGIRDKLERSFRELPK